MKILYCVQERARDNIFVVQTSTYMLKNNLKTWNFLQNLWLYAIIAISVFFVFTIRPQLLSLRASSTVYSTSSAAFAAFSTAFTAFSTAFTAFSTAFTVFSTAFTKFSTLPTLCSQLPILRSQTQEQDGCCGQTSFSCVSTRFSTTFQVFLGCSKDKRRRPICSHEIQR